MIPRYQEERRSERPEEVPGGDELVPAGALSEIAGQDGERDLILPEAKKVLEVGQDIRVDSPEVKVREMDYAKHSRHPMRVLLFINPASRRAAQLQEEILAELRSAGHEILNNDTGAGPVDPNQIILKYADVADAVIVAGGDGSVNLVLPALRDTRLSLLVIPCGTANNLARHYGIPCDVKGLVELLPHGKVVEIDLGYVNEIPFVNVAGLGLSTEVNRKVTKRQKQHFGAFAFVLTALQLARRMNPFRAVITTDDNVSLATKSWQISVCNGKHYGAGMTIKHNASLQDGKLHCLSTEVNRWWKALLLIRSFFTGRYRSEEGLTLVAGRELRIETRRRFHIDVDGDIKTTTPATFSVLPRALKLIVPEVLQ